MSNNLRCGSMTTLGAFYLFVCLNVLQQFVSGSTSVPDISVQMLPTTSMDVPLVSLMTLGAPLLFAIAYIFFLQFLAVILVSEKETFMKQHMLIMGMRESAYWYI